MYTLTVEWAWEMGSRDSFVAIATSYGLEGWGSIHGRGKCIFSTPLSPDEIWGPTSLLSSAYWDSLAGGKSAGA
jgi:hypothetical protein